jgi:predicted neuraminidase
MESHSKFKAFEIVHRGTVMNHIGTNKMKGDETYPFLIAPNAIQTPRGGMLVAWTGGAYEIAPNAVILGRETFDYGQTWNYDSVVMTGHAHCGQINTGFISTGDRMFMFYNTYAGRVRSVEGYFSDGTEDVWVKSSDDTGYSWTEPVQLSDYFERRQPYSLVVRQNGIRLTTGRLVLPVYLCTNYWPPIKKGQKREGFGLIISDDNGKTWRVCVHDISPEFFGCVEEPAVVQCADETLLMYFRTNRKTIWQSRSTDLGETWGPVTDTGIVGTAASVALCKLPDGRLVLAWNDHPTKRTFLSVAISKDDGKTWIGPDVVDMVCIEPVPPLQHEQVGNVGLAVDQEGCLWVIWAHIVFHNDGGYGAIKFARLRAL